MKFDIQEQNIQLTPETEEENIRLDIWLETNINHVFSVKKMTEGMEFNDLGDAKSVIRKPINISSSADPIFAGISNFAHTPFVLDGRTYQSVEGFWQGLKFEHEKDRRILADQWGGDPKRAAKGIEQPKEFIYQNNTIRAGSPEHHALMFEACMAKFTQNEAARASLLATGYRPLQHKLRRDSLTIPGAVMAKIWMRIREELREEV